MAPWLTMDEAMGLLWWLPSRTMISCRVRC